jgi:hypothetical protein
MSIFRKLATTIPVNAIISTAISTALLIGSFLWFVWPRYFRYDFENPAELNDISNIFAIIFLYAFLFYTIMFFLSLSVFIVLLWKKKYMTAYIWVYNAIISVAGIVVNFKLILHLMAPFV